MAIFKKQSIIKSFPAYDIVEREADSSGYVNITSDDKLASEESGFSNHFQAGSVASYALSNNECPIEAIERCKQNMESNPYSGHCLHWINSLSSSITSHKRDRETFVSVRIGMMVRFEGKLFTIQPDNNSNLKFQEA